MMNSFIGISKLRILISFKILHYLASDTFINTNTFLPIEGIFSIFLNCTITSQCINETARDP